MPYSQVSGRGVDARAGVTIGTTSGSAAITGSAGTFGQSDVGRTVTRAGIPAGTTIASVQSGTAATLSANATTTATSAAVLGDKVANPQGLGFFGWSPETEAEANSYSVAAVNAGTVPPDRIPNITTPIQLRYRG